MSKNIDYGSCKHCGKKFYTYVTAREALIMSKCPSCGRYLGKEDVTADVRTAMRL